MTVQEKKETGNLSANDDENHPSGDTLLETILRDLSVDETLRISLFIVIMLHEI